MDRINIRSNSPWEDIVGYSRAVKVGNQIFVSGTTATNSDGIIIGNGSPYQQTKQCLINIKSALAKANANISDVVRIKIYVVDISTWEDIGKALNECFSEIRPAATMVEVRNLITKEALVEIEAEAIIAK